jgi:putative transposase
MSRTTSRGTATVRQLCMAFGVSRQAFYAAAAPKPSSQPAAPATRPWASTGELETAIRRVIDEHRAWGVRKVWATLRRQQLRVSRKRVWAVMKRLGLVLPAPERHDSPRFGHVATAGSNRRWATDLTTVWTRQDGLVAIVPVIDCGDRFALDCQVTKSQESSPVLSPVARAAEAEFSDPSAVPAGLELRTDHGPQYTGRDCEVLCELWRLEHTFAPVGRPTGNAVAERFILTLKLELVWTRDWDSLAELRDETARWLTLYNEQRPHQALGWKTPAEQRALNLGDRLAIAA